MVDDNHDPMPSQGKRSIFQGDRSRGDVYVRNPPRKSRETRVSVLALLFSLYLKEFLHCSGIFQFLSVGKVEFSMKNYSEIPQTACVANR